MAATKTKTKKGAAPLLMDPNDLTIIGLDTEDTEDHQFYDDRIKLPVAEADVKNAMTVGIRQAIEAKKIGKQTVVTDGRQRVRRLRLANERLTKLGQPTLPIKVFIVKDNDANAFAAAISLNEFRTDDTLLGKARKAHRLVNVNEFSVEETASFFGCSGQTVRNWLKVLDLPKPFQKAVDNGSLPMTEAIKLGKGIKADATPKEQAEKAKKLVDKHATAKKNKKKSRGKADKGTRAMAPHRKILAAMADDESTELNQQLFYLIQWCAGTAQTSECDQYVKGFKAAHSRAKKRVLREAKKRLEEMLAE